MTVTGTFVITKALLTVEAQGPPQSLVIIRPGISYYAPSDSTAYLLRCTQEIRYMCAELATIITKGAQGFDSDVTEGSRKDHNMIFRWKLAK